MTGQHIGYIRVSSLTQNTARQLEGLELDKTFTDKASGKDTDRPQLQAMINHVREGDIVHIHSMDRLARNLNNLLSIVEDLNGKGVEVRFVKEGLTFGVDESSTSRLVLQIMGAVAEFERSLIKERQLEGIALAKKKGDVYTGRKPSLNDEQIDELIQRANAGEKKATLAREFGVSRATVYNILRA